MQLITLDDQQDDTLPRISCQYVHVVFCKWVKYDCYLSYFFY